MRSHTAKIPRLEDSTLPTHAMPFPYRMWYLGLKLAHFIWRYKSNPRYLITYLLKIADDSYKEQVTFMSDETFLKEAQHRSTLRLQDGEFTLLLGTRGISDQTNNKKLTQIYREAIHSYTDSSTYMLGLPPYIAIDNKTLHQHAFKYLWMPAKIIYKLLFHKGPQYFNGSYFYIDNTSANFMQTLSSGKNVLLVSNKDVLEATKLREDSFFKDALSVEYVETPSKNAFEQYEKIMHTIQTKSKHPAVVFMACGASGKAMIYELSKKGIVSHDIGWGLTGALTGESREHFLKWDIFGPLYQKTIHHDRP